MNLPSSESPSKEPFGRLAAYLNNAGRILLAGVILYFAWDTYGAYREMTARGKGPVANGGGSAGAASLSQAELNQADIVPFDFLSGGWQFAEVPWYVHLTQSKAKPGGVRSIDVAAPERPPAQRRQTELDRTILEAIRVFQGTRVGGGADAGAFSKWRVQQADMEFVLLTSPGLDSGPGEIVELLVGRMKVPGGEEVEVRLDYRAPHGDSSPQTLPLPNEAKILAARTDSQQRAIGDLITFRGEPDALLDYWRQEGYSVRRVPLEVSIIDFYTVERGSESYGVRPFGMFDSESHAFMIVRTSGTLNPAPGGP